MAFTNTYACPLSVQATTTGPTVLQAQATNRVSVDIIASADADTADTLTHSFGLTAAQLLLESLIVLLVPILQAPAALSLWAVTSHLTLTAIVTKATTGSSGNGAAQLRVHMLVHSLLD